MNWILASHIAIASFPAHPGAVQAKPDLLMGVILARSLSEPAEAEEPILAAKTEAEVRQLAEKLGLVVVDIHDGAALVCPPSELDPDGAATKKSIIDELVGVAAYTPVRLTDVSPVAQASANSIINSLLQLKSTDPQGEVCLTTNSQFEISDGTKTVKFLRAAQPDLWRKATDRLKKAIVTDRQSQNLQATGSQRQAPVASTKGLSFVTASSNLWKRNEFLGNTQYFADLILKKSLTAREALDKSIDEGLKKLRPDLGTTDERRYQGKRMGDVPKAIGDSFSRYMADNWRNYGFDSANSAEVFARGASIKGVKQTIFLSFAYKGTTGVDVISNFGLN
jgi:hypothetical protein